MPDDHDAFDAFERDPARMTDAERAHYRRVLLALVRVHSDEYAIEWLCEHQRVLPRERSVREAVVLNDYGLIA